MTEFTRQLAETGMRISHRHSELYQENARLRAELARYQAFVAAYDLLEDIHGATMMATRDAYNAAVLSVRATRQALAALDAGGREGTT